MKIRFTSTIGGRTVGDVADLDPDSARWLVDREYAEAIGDDQDDAETPPRPRRGRPPKAPTLVDGE